MRPIHEDERLEIHDDPSEAELRFVEDQVDELNMAATRHRVPGS